MATKAFYVTIRVDIEGIKSISPEDVASVIAEECDYSVRLKAELDDESILEIVDTELLDVTTEIPECGYYAG